MTDLLSRLTEARPTTDELDRMWTPAQRDARLASLLADTAAARRPHRGRRVALLGAAATVAAAAAVVPTVLAPDDAAAADLRELALNAASYDGPVLTEGTWLHERSTSLQIDQPYDGHPGATYDHDRETWSSWDGRTLLLTERSASRGSVEYDVLRDRAEPSYADPTPQFAATLPDDADGLRAYLDPRVHGSSSHQEAVYSALSQLIGSRTLPPRTLAAAYEALAGVEDVTTADVRVEGRPAVEIGFVEDQTSSRETLVVDRATGQALSVRTLSEQSDYSSTTVLSEVVDGVPADVRAEFREHAGEGTLVEASGEPYVG